MPSSNAIAPPPSTALIQLSTVNRPSGQDGRPERASRAEGSLCRRNSFRITYICKNASVNPYGSHIYKTKDLKSFRITYLQKKGGGYPCFPLSAAFRSDRSRLSTLNYGLPTSRTTGHGALSAQSRLLSGPITSHQSPPFPNGCIITKRADLCRN